MGGISEVSAPIAAIHDCAEGDDRWQDALERMSRFHKVINFAIGTVDPDRDFFESLNLRIDPTFEQSYINHWAPRNFLVRRSATLPVGTLFSFDTTMPRAEFRKTAFYNEWWHPQGMDQAIGANLVSGGSMCVYATAYRPLAAPEFSDQDAQCFRVLLPHLRRAMELRARLRRTDRARPPPPWRRSASRPSCSPARAGCSMRTSRRSDCSPTGACASARTACSRRRYRTRRAAYGTASKARCA